MIPASSQQKKNNDASTSSNYLSYAAKQQAQKGTKIEKDVVEKDTDASTLNRQNPTQCHSCNKITYVSFEPDGKRPVYCKNCLREIRMKRGESREKKGVTDMAFKAVANNGIQPSQQNQGTARRIAGNYVGPARVGRPPEKTMRIRPKNFSGLKDDTSPEKILSQREKKPTPKKNGQRLQPGQVITFSNDGKQ